MTDELKQLSKSLSLSQTSSSIDSLLKWAEKSGVSYSEFLLRILREELCTKKERSTENRIKNSKLPCRWSLETFPFERQPSINKAQINQIAKLDFVSCAENIVFIGPTGVGKTGLASAIMLKGLENGYRGLFIKAQDLFDDMYASLADKTTKNFINRLSNIDILLIDEMGFLNLKPEHSNIFFRLMDSRYGQKSTIITTNLEYEEWYEFLKNKSLVSGLLDRMLHRCHTIKINGTSLRTPQI